MEPTKQHWAAGEPESQTAVTGPDVFRLMAQFTAATNGYKWVPAWETDSIGVMIEQPLPLESVRMQGLQV